MKIFQNLLVFVFVVLFGYSALASTECEQSKLEILARCDEIESDLIVITNNLTISKSYFDSTYISINTHNSYVGVISAPFNSLDLYDSEGNALGLRASDLFYYINNSLGLARADLSAVETIRSTVNSIQCSGSNTCNCAELLEPILEEVSRISTEVVSIQSIVDEIHPYIIDISENIGLIVDNFDNVFEYYNYITNCLAWPSNINSTPAMLVKAYLMQSTSGDNFIPFLATNTKFPGYSSNTSFKRLTLSESIGYGFENTLVMLASLNNYFGTNTIAVSSLHKSSVSNNVALGTASRLLERGFDAVTNQFSIFIESSAGASPVLGAYTSNDGSYHDYLTNYYIKVSSSSVSGSTPLTNWFNRIEMLLAALVFQEDDGPNTNSVPGSSSYDNLESELNQNMTTINQQGQDYLNTVDTSGKSLLAMLREWNGAVSGVAKPSAFVIASIPTPSSSPTRSSSGGSGSSLDITLDTDNESLAGFIELVRGVTTLAWVTLFLVVGYYLSIRIVTLIGKLISFGYSVYSAVFGGG